MDSIKGSCDKISVESLSASLDPQRESPTSSHAAEFHLPIRRHRSASAVAPHWTLDLDQCINNHSSPTLQSVIPFTGAYACATSSIPVTSEKKLMRAPVGTSRGPRVWRLEARLRGDLVECLPNTAKPRKDALARTSSESRDYLALVRGVNGTSPCLC